MDVLLAKIEFSFLEKQREVRGWDNTFYDLFLIFSSFESRFVDLGEEIDDRMLFITNTNVYVKEYQRNCIQVYLRKLQENQKGLEKLHQIYLFFIYDVEEILTIKELIQKVKEYLNNSGKKYQIVKKESEEKFISLSKAIFYIGLEVFD